MESSLMADNHAWVAREGESQARKDSIFRKRKPFPVKVVWIGDWFADVFHQRIGWQRNLKPAFCKLPGAYELLIGPLMLFWERRPNRKHLPF